MSIHDAPRMCDYNYSGRSRVLSASHAPKCTMGYLHAGAHVASPAGAAIQRSAFPQLTLAHMRCACMYASCMPSQQCFDEEWQYCARARQEVPFERRKNRGEACRLTTLSAPSAR